MRGRECRRKEEAPRFHPPTPQLFKINMKVKGPSPISSSNVTTHPPHNQTIPKEESRRKRYEEVRGCMGKYEEVMEEGRGQRVQRSKVPRSSGPKVPGSQGPRYLKLTFKYELDSKEGPSYI